MMLDLGHSVAVAVAAAVVVVVVVVAVVDDVVDVAARNADVTIVYQAKKSLLAQLH